MESSKHRGHRGLQARQLGHGVNRGPEDDEFKEKENRDCEAVLLGRITYQEFAKSWPAMEGEFAAKLNSVAKQVVSSTLEEPLEWNNSRSGKRLFASMSDKKRMQLSDSKTVGDGITILVYEAVAQD